MIPWREVLEFEREAPEGSAKHRAIRERFGISPGRYYQRLNQVLDQDHVLGFDPMLVARLRRVRDRRRLIRSARRAGLLPPDDPPWSRR